MDKPTGVAPVLTIANIDCDIRDPVRNEYPTLLYSSGKKPCSFAADQQAIGMYRHLVFH